jgi:DNA-binding MarR family transcriptional regulator
MKCNMKLENTLIYKLQAFSRQLDYALESVVTRDSDISYGRYRVLVAIHEGGMVTITDVAKWLDIAVPTSSHLCYRLAVDGHISIDSKGKSTKQLRLTEQGISLLEHLNPLLENVLDDCLSVLNVGDRKIFMNSLQKMSNKLKNEDIIC